MLLIHISTYAYTHTHIKTTEGNFSWCFSHLPFTETLMLNFNFFPCWREIRILYSTMWLLLKYSTLGYMFSCLQTTSPYSCKEQMGKAKCTYIAPFFLCPSTPSTHCFVESQWPLLISQRKNPKICISGCYWTLYIASLKIVLKLS